MHEAQRNARVIRLAIGVRRFRQNEPRVHCARLHAPYSGPSRKVGRQSSGEPREFGIQAGRSKAVKEVCIGRWGNPVSVRFLGARFCGLLDFSIAEDLEFFQPNLIAIAKTLDRYGFVLLARNVYFVSF